MRVLCRGVDTPPHIAVVEYLVSLTTKAYSVKNFEEIISRILREVELK